MLRGAVFDFDGVIVDSHPVHKRAWKKLLDSAGKEVSEEDLQFVLEGRKRDEILLHFLGELDVEQITEYGHRKEEFFRGEAESVQAMCGLPTFLEELDYAQLALGVASSGSKGRVTFLLDHLELAKHFRVIVTGDDVEKGKPHPAIFLKAARDLEVDPAELIVFEDAVSGIEAARTAGMKCVGVAQSDRASILLDAGAGHVVSDFRCLSYTRIREMFDASI